MQPGNRKHIWAAVAVCIIASTGLANAEEGVVRLNNTDNAESDGEAGVVRMNANAAAPIRPPAIVPPNTSSYYQSNAYSPQDHFAAYAQYYGLQQPQSKSVWQPVQYTQSMGNYGAPANFGMSGFGGEIISQSTPAYGGDIYGGTGEVIYGGTDLYSSNSFGCDAGGWGGSCDTGGCGTEGCNTRSRGRRGRRNSCDSCEDCSYDAGFQKRLRLLAGAAPKGTCGGARWPGRFWRGQQFNYLSRNQRLANHLFGWLIPSGCGGQGCPPCGKYGITYADDPAYADSRDAQAYGAQGYGVPMTVPLAPNVRYAYNFSWGTPSSRLTQIGSYDPQTSPQPLYRQTW